MFKNEFSQHIFEKISDAIFHENPYSGKRIIACGAADGRTVNQTDMKRIIVAFHNIADAPKFVF